MSIGLLILGVVVGLTLAAHGTQKLFGWFGGPGLKKTAAGLAGAAFQLATRRPPAPQKGV
jgi:putative oxidoreductase